MSLLSIKLSYRGIRLALIVIFAFYDIGLALYDYYNIQIPPKTS